MDQENSIMDISILIPGIRPDLWKSVYDSVQDCFHGTWEIVFAGPSFPSNLSGVPNIKWIHSLASPMVCRQMALIEARGDYICYAADDVTFCAKALDEAYITMVGRDHMDFVVGKYAEGEGTKMLHDPYWHLNHHGFLQQIMGPYRKDYFLVNTGLIPRKLMIDIGGFDCQFECCAMGCCDLSLRLQIHGAKGILQNNPFFTSTHLPGLAGDHGPIHDAQTQHDMPLFLDIWKSQLNRTLVPLDNWKQQPERWERRFGPA